jgi:hypothetical protein
VLGQTPTGDGFHASNGTYFVDLSGFGAESPDGAIRQLLGLVSGATYAFSMDLGTSNSGTISASVGGSALSLVAGSAFNANGTSWTTWTSSFVAGSNSALLSIQNATPGSQVDLLDRISVTGPTPGGSVPEPESWALMLLGFGGLGAALRRGREAIYRT